MANYTYQEKKTNLPLESIEWDRIWMENPAERDVSHVLILGDSISEQYRPKLSSLINHAAKVNGYATSKALDNPSLLPTLALIAQQLPRCDVLLFNNGLHGCHLSGEEYEAGYRRVLAGLKELFPQTPIALVLTTPVRMNGDLEKLGERTQIVRQRNGIVREIAQENGLPVVDFYSAVVDHPEYWSQDACHFAPAGADVLARVAAEQIKKML